jgi:uncharacterized protein (DUF58 family)
MAASTLLRRLGAAIGLAPPARSPAPARRAGENGQPRSGGANGRAPSPGRRVAPPADATAAERAGNGTDRRGRGSAGVPKEILKQVRLIELRTRGLVSTMFSGEYHSVFRGQGMEFAEVREYQPGDDVRTIEWNVTARMGHPFIKKYVEERELTVLLAVDLSGSEQFGTRGRFKAELATEMAAVLALSAVRNNDRVGLLVFSDHVEHFVPPRKGRRHVLRIIRDLLAFRPLGRGTDLAGALDYVNRVLRHRSIVFVLSDFLTALAAPGEAAEGGEAESGEKAAGERVERMLRVASKRHDVVAVTIADLAEEALPRAGVLSLQDPESSAHILVDTADPATQAHYSAAITRERGRLRRILRQLRIEEIEVRTTSSYVGPLLAFFRRRERQLRR